MRLDQLTFTRFIAALGIVMFHFLEHNNYIYDNSYVNFLVSKANVGVSYFFVLSGFVMMIAYHKGPVSPADYYFKRLVRIYPIYFLSLAAYVVYQLLSHQHVTWLEFVLNAFTIQAWVPTLALSLNFPGWSISNEFFFYAVFPFLLNIVYKRIPFRWCAAGGFIIWVISQIIAFKLNGQLDSLNNRIVWNNLLYYFPILHLNEFLIGNLAGILFLRNRDLRIKYNSIFIVIILILIYFFLKESDLYYHNGLLAFLFSAFIFLLSSNSGFFFRFFSNKVLVFLGEISFGIYILQKPVHMFFTYFLRAMHISFNFWVYLIVLIIVSSISYYLIELPIQMWGKKNIKKRFILSK